jgi:murein DD-endopeptidase MepM/ murein hydrolase activator NlpD
MAVNLILVSKQYCKSCSVCLTKPAVILSVVLMVGIISAALIAAGYRLGAWTERDATDVYRASLHSAREHELDDIAAARREAREHLDALTFKLGQLQAQVIRLEALGQRLTNMAGLADGEFDFATLPPQGGPAATEAQSYAVPDFVSSLDELAHRLEDRGQQLSVLESMLQSRQLQQQVLPEGSPVRTGYISSGFGLRADPFHGSRGLHMGIDFAGPAGSGVHAVAAGVVVSAEYRPDFGHVVDINHGNGYVTRYAHNQKLTVSVGETVKKGQVIAKLGSSGRASGPHVHFEVLHNGKNVNPARFVGAFDVRAGAD